jgi:CHAT domain-containing protein
MAATFRSHLVSKVGVRRRSGLLFFITIHLAATALVVGGPDFDSPGAFDLVAATAPETLLAPNPVLSTSNTYRSSVPSCEAFRSMRFAPLPGAVAEADEVASLLSTKTPATTSDRIMKLTGKLASEQSLKELSAGRAILHIATHGFFLSRDCLDSGAPGGRGGAAGASPFLDNPLLLSGLAMAGANLRLGDPAAEVASLDLRGVEWAVLSACETGLGPIQVGEGVLGLRRAFQIAGARTLIMSLWERV